MHSDSHLILMCSVNILTWELLWVVWQQSKTQSAVAKQLSPFRAGLFQDKNSHQWSLSQFGTDRIFKWTTLETLAPVLCVLLLGISYSDPKDETYRQSNHKTPCGLLSESSAVSLPKFVIHSALLLLYIVLEIWGRVGVCGRGVGYDCGLLVRATPTLVMKTSKWQFYLLFTGDVTWT